MSILATIYANEKLHNSLGLKYNAIYVHILTASSGPSSTATRHEDEDIQRKYSTTQTQNLDIYNLHPTFKA